MLQISEGNGLSSWFQGLMIVCYTIICSLQPPIIKLRPKKKNCLIGVTQPTLFLSPTLKYFYFIVCKNWKKNLKKIKVKQIFSFGIAICKYTSMRKLFFLQCKGLQDIQNDILKMCYKKSEDVHLYHLFFCIFVICVFWYAKHRLKKKKPPTYLPYFFLC